RSASPPPPQSFPTRRSSDLNDRGYRLGDQVTAHGWIGYRLNDHVAVTSGVIAESWGSIRGVPTDVTIGRDPGEDPVFSGGSRVRSEEHTSELQSRENLVCRL